MRKYFAFFALVSLLAAACAKEEPAPAEAPEGSYEFSLMADVDSPLTKTSYAGEQTFSWSAGDQISVLFHNGATDKFFTLTTASSGASVTFTGTIDAGYTIGASDGEHEKIAFFPAGDHSYDPSLEKPAVFHIPAFTDFTKSHFSANIPMAAIGDGSNHFSFYHIAGAYKVTFGSIDPSVSKVKLHVKNQTTQKLSGDYTMQDGLTRWWSEWASEGSQDQTVSYVVNVSDGKAVFYIPYGHNQDHFLPVFTLTNAVNGNTLKVVSAKDKDSFIGTGGERKSLKTRIVVLPEIPASGTGTAPGWRSNHSINWDMVDTSVGGRTSTNYAGINQMKVTSDAENLYILLDIKTSYLLDNAGYGNSNYLHVYIGDGSDSGSTHWSWADHYQNDLQGWLKTGNNLSFTATAGANVDAIAHISGEHCYYEIAYPRLGNSALMGTSAVIACLFDKRYKIGETVYNDPTEGDTPVGYAPKSWDPMMSITLPEYGTLPPTPLPANLSFTEASDDVANPERGFYKHFEYKFNGSVPSTTIASYTFDDPLVLTIFYLRDYRESDHLPDAVLNKVDAEWAAAKAKGKKVIARFAYTWLEESPHDPSPAQVLNHLDDLAPKFTKYEDILYLVQAGFIGTYGEWYFKDADFTWTKSGSTLSGYDNASSVVTKMLAVVPESRQIALRTPFYKRWYLYPSAINTTVPDITSWGTEPNQRIAYYNDGFRGSSSDIGTFDYDMDRPQWYGQGEWLACGGESAYKGGETVSTKQAWLDANTSLANPDNSIAALKQQHMSYLHDDPTNILMDYWAGSSDGSGHFDWGGANKIPEFKKALGYRLVLSAADFTGSLTSGSTVNYSISIRNKGCARVIYPRPCMLVLLHNGTPVVLKDNLLNVRDLDPDAGSATVASGSFVLPQDVYKNDQLAIWLPDNAAGLQATPAYSIHLANNEVTWSDGYNIIHTF